MNTPLQALIIEDSADDALMVVDELRNGGYDVTWERVETAEAMRAALGRQPWDILIADYKMPSFSGLAALELLKASGRGLPFIIVSGKIGEDLAVAALKAGANDYIMKDKLGRLVPAVKRELRDAALWRENRRADVALHESEEKFRRLFESSQDAIMVIAPPSWRFTSGNPATVKMFGAKSEEEFTAHGSWELSPERQPDGRASAEKSKEMIETALRKGSHFFEWTHRRISGEEFPADVLLTRMEQGGTVVVQATVRDITERKRAEGALRASEVRYRRLFEAAKDGILILNAETGRIVDVNPFLLELLGRSRDEILGKKIWEMKSFKDVVANQANFAELRQKGNVRYEEKSLETADGRRIDVEFDSHVYLVDHYRVVQCRIRDVTERMRAEERIREQAALLDNANDAIYVMALDFTILFWNRGAERTYGWTSGEALNRKTAELLAVDLAAAEALIAVLFKQESWSGERWQMTKDGRKVEVFSRLTLVRDKQGQPQSVFAINTDITEKRQLEAQFLRAQRLESIGALASGIAHDLNNVLAPILMGAPLLREMSNDETSRQLLKTMESSALRGAAIVRQVLTFARGVEGERVALQPRHLLREMEGIAKETFPKSIRIESDVASDLWPVLGDSTQLHQVLMNLCVNARDAMPGGGVLTLGAANIVLTKETAGKIPGAQPGSYVCLRVIDTGTGIPPEIEAKIFEPFFTTKGAGKGTGLGLSTVVGIVRSHGGFVRVASKVGQGSTFELYLPATSTGQVMIKKDSASPWAHAHAHGEGILVVDDEAAIREVVRQTLEAFGFQVITAGHGGEALRIFKEHQQEIQLVLTDMMMPEMDGPTLVAALRVLNPAVRIVGITGMGDPAGMSGMKTLALTATLAKPFTIKEILAAVREALPVAAGHEGSAPAGGGSRPAPPR